MSHSSSSQSSRQRLIDRVTDVAEPLTKDQCNQVKMTPVLTQELAGNANFEQSIADEMWSYLEKRDSGL